MPIYINKFCKNTQYFHTISEIINETKTLLENGASFRAKTTLWEKTPEYTQRMGQEIDAVVKLVEQEQAVALENATNNYQSSLRVGNISIMISDINEEKGDLTLRIEARKNDEIGQIVSGVNSLMGVLQKIMVVWTDNRM